MASNIGKVFEQQIKKSVPEYALAYRLQDSTGSFGGSNLRFSNKNPFDFLIWDSKRRILYALELKSVSGRSISFERSKEERGEIHYHQIQGLLEWSKYDWTVCGLLIEFREAETTIFLDVGEFMRLSDSISKKSFNLKDLASYRHVVVPQTKHRTRYTYDIEYLLSASSTDMDLKEEII